MEGLDFAPFPGAKGQDFFENVSKQAWQETHVLSLSV
jgi:Fe-S cluster biosynthesis and repair protein YggX